MYEIDLAEIEEPILCCPNDPGYAKPLSAKPLSPVAGAKIDEVFIGACMTNKGTYLPPANCWTRWKAASWYPPVAGLDYPHGRMEQTMDGNSGSSSACSCSCPRRPPSRARAELLHPPAQ